LDERKLQVALREHVHALAVDIGPRTPSTPGSLARAANYIHSVLADSGLSTPPAKQGCLFHLERLQRSTPQGGAG
jgi:hypothetical protein